MDITAFDLNYDVCKLLRFMLFRNPVFAEGFYNRRSFMFDQVNEGIKVFSDRKERVYIILDGINKLTTKSLPEKYAKEKIAYIPESNSLTLKGKLESWINDLYAKSEQPKLYNYQSILQSVTNSYNYYKERQGPVNILLHNYFSQSALEEADYTDKQIKAWALDEIKSLVEKYLIFEFCGDDLIEPLCTLYFIYFSPNSSFIYRQGIFPLKEIQGTSRDGRIFKQHPILQFPFYLDNKNINASQRVVIFKDIAIFLHKQATSLRRKALEESTFHLFYESLYEAGFYYRSAESILQNLLESSNQEIRDILKTLDTLELKRIERNCEEMQTLIYVSLNSCVDRNSEMVVNFTNAIEVDELVTKWKNGSISGAEGRIMEYSLALKFPDIYRDYLLGLVYCLSEDTIEEGIRRLVQFVQKTEENLFLSTVMADPNFLSPAYEVLATANSIIGEPEKSKIYQEKSTNAYLRSRIAEEIMKHSKQV